ncbi:hypothetical protein BS17DRAFT_766204 [Gyrodon lividus]|nr:hypothetical protein BS17DRAFT_766204 [Gyrodon lividus]
MAEGPTDGACETLQDAVSVGEVMEERVELEIVNGMTEAQLCLCFKGTGHTDYRTKWNCPLGNKRLEQRGFEPRPGCTPVLDYTFWLSICNPRGVGHIPLSFALIERKVRQFFCHCNHFFSVVFDAHWAAAGVESLVWFPAIGVCDNTLPQGASTVAKRPQHRGTNEWYGTFEGEGGRLY